MKNKQDLAKVALAALILASSAPMMAQAYTEAQGIMLAGGCGSDSDDADAVDEAPKKEEKVEKANPGSKHHSSKSWWDV